MSKQEAKSKKFVGNENVIIFPKLPQKHLTKEEIDLNKTVIVYERINNSLETIVENFVYNLKKQGVDLNESERCIKEFALCIEAIKGILFSTHGVEHPMQLVAKNLFVTEKGIVRLNSQDKIKRLMSKKKVVKTR